MDDFQHWFARFGAAVRILPEQQRRRSLLPLLHAYSAPATAVDGSRIPAQRFREAVRRASLGPDGDIPHLSPQLISKYVSDLRLLGLV